MGRRFIDTSDRNATHSVWLRRVLLPVLLAVVTPAAWAGGIAETSSGGGAGIGGSLLLIGLPAAGVILGAVGALIAARFQCRKDRRQRQRIMRAYRVISECNKVLTRSRDEQDLAQEICNLLVKSGNYSLAWVGYAQEDGQRSVRPFAAAGDHCGYLERIHLEWADDSYGRGPVGVAIREGHSTAVQNIDEKGEEVIPWKEAARACGYRSLMALPLRLAGREIGALTMYSPDPGAFDAHERELLQGLAEDLSYGIEALRTAAERERIRAELARQQARLKRAEELGGLGSWEYDIRTGTLHWSDETFRLFGYRPGEVTPTLNLVLGHLPEKLRGQLESRTQNLSQLEGGIYTLEHSLRRSDGTAVHVLTRADIHTNEEGQPERVFGAFHDISERKWWEEALQRTLGEREELLQELLHRSKNTLQLIASMLHLRRSGVEDQSFRNLLLELEGKIYSIAKVHENLYLSESFSALDVRKYIRELGQLLIDTLGVDTSRISMRYEMEELRESLETSVPLGLVINELLTNAVRHAFPEDRSGEIRIGLSDLGDGWRQLSVADNGVGLPEEVQREEAAGLGLQTIDILVRSQLRGSFTYWTSGQGTECRVRFPSGVRE
jgi:PAS domain S-box-containing protein